MINSFKGQYRFLSNFYALRNPILYEGLNYLSSEHFYQAMKTTDRAGRIDIAKLSSAGATKRAGSALVLRPDWEQIKIPVMKYALGVKFGNNPELKTRLLATGNEKLVEGNYWHDNFWGDCSCPKCAGIKGQNFLGQLLMELRAESQTSITNSLCGPKEANVISCNVTGHRKIVPPGYNGKAWWAPTCEIVQQYHNVLKQRVISEVLNLYQKGITEFISGGAIGADILFAEVIVHLRDVYHYPITLGIAKPFPGQAGVWGQATVIRYNNILALANWVHTVSPDPFSPHKMQVRNEWMVNRAGITIALWNGVQRGGTWNCINYARQQGKNIITINT